MTLSSSLFCDTCGAGNRAQASFCRVCGTSLRPPNTTISMTLTGLLAQDHLLKQRYLILGPAGRGGFGAVYKASDTQLGNRLIAIKEMSQRSLSGQELSNATEDFNREAFLLASLTHPNLPQILDQFTENGRSYLVMEFIDGETLEEHLQRLSIRKLSVEKALDIALQLCSVLEYLHTHHPPIIFRDLKPSNIMYTSSGHVYLIDFGIARLFKPGQAKDTTALGSAGYAAPEQYGRSQTTVRTDIYGLGATLHNLLSGDDPSASPFHFAPLELPQNQLKELNTLIMSMVNVEIARRPESVSSVRQQLQQIAARYTQSSPLSNLPGTYLPPLQPIPATASNGSSKLSRAPRSHTQPQIRPMSNLLFACYGHTARVTSVAWSPDGKVLASASYDKTVRFWDGSNGQHRFTSTDHHDHVNDLSWSPDGKYLASASNDGQVLIWESTTGKQCFAYTQHTGQVLTVAWSLDGRYLASAGTDKTVHLWTMKENKTLQSYSGHLQAINTVAWSPDSKCVASGGEDCKIHLWHPQQEQAKRSFFSLLFSTQRSQEKLKGHQKRINRIAWSPDGRRLVSASSDQYVRLWDATTGHYIESQGNNKSGMKNDVAWSPNNQHVAIACNNKTVLIWNTHTRAAPYVYRGHVNYVMAVAWSPDGSRIASASVDRTIQVWQAK